MPASIANKVEVDPCGTVTLAGRVRTAGDALIAMAAPPLRAGDVSVTVQVDPSNDVREVGVHVMPLKEGACRIVTVPPLAEVDIAAPLESAETPLVTWTEEEVSCVEPATVSVTEATTLLGIAVGFSPQTRQVAVPTPLLQESDLLAAAGPGVKVAVVKSVGE